MQSAGAWNNNNVTGPRGKIFISNNYVQFEAFININLANGTLARA